MNDFPDMKTDQQVSALQSIQKGLLKISELVQRINTINVENNLNLPALEVPMIGMVYHAADGVLFDHELDEAKLRRQIGAERMAA